jgi:putative membrane-bound dehydrogenase-like protein
MKFPFALLLILFTIAACSATAAPSPTPDIEAIVSATLAVREQALYQPRLLSPEDNAVFSNPSEVSLAWEWVRSLEEGEHFDLRVWREGQPAYGITWTEQTSFALSDWLSQQEAGEYFWTVAVITGADGTVEDTIGEAPPPRRFSLGSNQFPTATPVPAITADQIATVPAGFNLQIFSQLLEAPTAVTAIVFEESGDLLALAIDGRIFRLHDADSDGLADETSQILFNLPESPVHLEWAIGMALYEDRIYISDKSRVGYITDSDNDGIYDTHQVIVEGLPSLEYPLHSNNGIAFGADGKLYVSVGSTSDHGPLNPEFPYESSILRMNPDGSDLEVFATGFRNSYDISFSPDGRLFAGDNAPDSLDNSLPFYPPEELNYIVEGGDYGFPDVYGDNFVLRETERETITPVTLLPTSTVTSGITYYSADAFPEAYHDGVFISQYGGFRRLGRAIIFIPLIPDENGNYQSDWQHFMGFRENYHPVDVMQGPDGALYIVEWTASFILRVSYNGGD